jgi:hypothetical protein
MRRPRLKAPASHPVAYYHLVSRVVNRDFVLGEAEKDKLVEYMRTYEQLYGPEAKMPVPLPSGSKNACPSAKRSWLFLPP